MNSSCGAMGLAVSFHGTHVAIAGRRCPFPLPTAFDRLMGCTEFCTVHESHGQNLARIWP